MSGKFSSAVMLVSLVAILVAANRADESEALSGGSTRGPASVVDDKSVVLGAFKAEPSVHHTEKIQGPLDVSLSSPDGSAETFTLVATLSAHKDLSGGIDYSWSVPAGLEMVRGEMNGHIETLMASAPVHISAVFHKTVEGNLQIHLLAKAHSPNLRFAKVAQFNTDARPTKTAGVKALTVYH